MSTQPVGRWQYQVVNHGTGIEAANANMEEWAAAGWELVSGTVEPFRGGTMCFIAYWRRAV